MPESRGFTETIQTSPGAGGDFVQLSHSLGRKLQGNGPEIFMEMLDGRRAGNDQDIRRPLQQPGQRNLSRRCTNGRCGLVQNWRPEGLEATQREERNEGDPLSR